MCLGTFGTAGCVLPQQSSSSSGSVAPISQRENTYCTYTYTHTLLYTCTGIVTCSYLLICSVVICPVLLRLQKQPLRHGCCDLRCTSVALLSNTSRASHRALICSAWAPDTARPDRLTRTSASCPTLSHPGIPLGSGVMSAVAVIT